MLITTRSSHEDEHRTARHVLGGSVGGQVSSWPSIQAGITERLAEIISQHCPSLAVSPHISSPKAMTPHAPYGRSMRHRGRYRGENKDFFSDLAEGKRTVSVMSWSNRVQYLKDSYKLASSLISIWTDINRIVERHLVTGQREESGLCRNMYLPERHNLLPFHTYDIALGRQLLHASA